MKYRLDTKKPNLLCLILLISLPSVVTVLISPALPAISSYFRITSGYSQQLITIFVVGYALGQLIYAAFANRYGRKVAIYLGLSLYLISCLLCLVGIYLHSFELLLLGRLLTALGAAVGMIISFTIINDFYHPEQARPIVAYTVLAYAIMPALAVFVGGFITSHISWIGCFYFYFIYGIVVLLTSSRLPETLTQKNLHALKVKPLIKNYVHAFSNRRLLLFSLIYGLMSSFIYITASAGPFIAINNIGLSAAVYGSVLLIPYLGQVLGGLSAGRLSKRFTAYHVIRMGYSSIALGTVFMLLCFIFGWVNSFSLIAPIFFIMLGLPLVYSSVTVMALVDYEDKATGSSVMSFITMTTTLIATFILTLLPHRYALVMPLMFVAVLLLAFFTFWQVTQRYSDR